MAADKKHVWWEGNVLHFDLENVSAEQPTGRLPAPQRDGDFASRVAERQVDLNTLIEQGLPELEFLPASDGMLVKGGRHQITAPRKSGKSISGLAHFTRMAMEGAKVVILDRENGSWLYASRLEALFRAWGLEAERRREISERLLYLDFPRLQMGDGEELAALAVGLGADLVVFDAQRMFLTDLGLTEDSSDDYARFIDEAINPLFAAGLATLIFDNTGHGEQGRSRGSSAKGDLNEVLFALQTETAFSQTQRGRLKLVLAPGDSRYGNEGTWVMPIGGGHFGEWRRLGSPEAPSPEAQTKQPDRARALLLAFVRENPGSSKRQAIRAVKGKGQGTGDDKVREAWRALIEAGQLEATGEGFRAVEE